MIIAGEKYTFKTAFITYYIVIGKSITISFFFFPSHTEKHLSFERIQMQ